MNPSEISHAVARVPQEVYQAALDRALKAEMELRVVQAELEDANAELSSQACTSQGFLLQESHEREIQQLQMLNQSHNKRYELQQQVEKMREAGVLLLECLGAVANPRQIDRLGLSEEQQRAILEAFPLS